MKPVSHYRLLGLTIGVGIGVNMVAGTFAVLAILGVTAVSWPIFFLWLGLLVLANLWWLFYYWRGRTYFSEWSQVTVLLWAGISLWFWTAAPFYYFLTMNLNELQLAWTAFAFFWEVPIVGGLFVMISSLLFRRLQWQLSNLQETSISNFYKATFNYPVYVSLALFLTTVVGYTIGAWQLVRFAYLPRIELFKSLGNGVFISLLLGIFFYVVFDYYGNQLRRRSAKSWPTHSLHPRRSLWVRIAALTAIVILTTIGYDTLIAFKTAQFVTEQTLTRELLRDIDQLDTLFRQSDSMTEEVLSTFRKGESGFLEIVEPGEALSVNVGRGIKEQLESHERGVLRDLHEEPKLIAFFRPPVSRQIVVSVAYLRDFNVFFQRQVLSQYVVASLIPLTMAVVVLMIVAFTVTRALKALAYRVVHAESTPTREPAILFTGDEIETLSHQFVRYFREARRLRKNLEQRVEHLKEVDRLKSEFVSLASHQLRAPLTAINWYIELFMKNIPASLSSTQLNDLEKIRKGSSRMVRLVNSLLNVARLDSGRLTIQPISTNLLQFLDSLVSELQPLAQHHGCELSFLRPATTFPRLAIDKSLLRQVLTNLVENALKYSGDAKKCRVEVMAAQRAEQGYVIAVKDWGIGIPLKDQPYVFKKFFRASNAARVDTEGSGLGLYVGKMIMRASGGNLGFVSEHGKGSTFFITIPANGMMSHKGEVGLA